MTLLLSLLTCLASATASTAQAPAVSHTDLRLQAGSVELAATLSVPAAAGRRPAILLLAGSGPAPRLGLVKFSSHLNSIGFATLIYDKRGSGQSTGSWTTASMDDMVSDAQAALTALADDERIDRSRIGVWGVSQAGWFIPVLADRAPNLAFAIVLTGGGSTPKEVELFMHEETLTRVGASETERRKALDLLAAYFSWLGGAGGRDRVLGFMRDASGQPWFTALGIDRVMPSEANRPNWAWVATFDPKPYIEKMTLPALVLLGSDDRMGSTPLAAERWRDGLGRAGNPQSRVEVIAGMGHAATIGSTHEQGGATMPAYFEAVERFLAAWRQ